VQGGLLALAAPQICVLLAGANDLGPAGGSRTWSQVLTDLGSLVDVVLAAGDVRVVLVEQILMSGAISHELTDHTRHQQAINAGLYALAAARGGKVSVARASVIPQRQLDASGVHPTDVGYQMLAYAIYYALAPWLGADVGDGSRYMVNIDVPLAYPRLIL
jgi:lysophospholipase L1-like esterase